MSKLRISHIFVQRRMIRNDEMKCIPSSQHLVYDHGLHFEALLLAHDFHLFYWWKRTLSRILCLFSCACLFDDKYQHEGN